MKSKTFVQNITDRSLRRLGMKGSVLAASLVLISCGGGGGGSSSIASRFSLVQTCVSDSNSGLTWQKLPGLTKSYTDLAAYVTAEGVAKTCGLTDWRLPSVNELLGLMNTSVTTGNPLNADADVSGDRMMTKYWTSETSAVASVDAWLVDTANGATVDVAIKNSALSVRLVRGGVSTPTSCDNADSRFVAQAGDMVNDRVTKLMWKKCAEGYTNSACTSGTLRTVTSKTQVTNILAENNTLDSSIGRGYSDWRVPTKNELASLVNRTCSSPALLSTIFPNIGLLNYVTATVDADAPTTRLWSVNFTDGSIGPSLLGGPFSIRLVRTGF